MMESWFRTTPPDLRPQHLTISPLGDIGLEAAYDVPRQAHSRSARTDAPDCSPLSLLGNAKVEFLSESGPLQVFSIKLTTSIQSDFEYLTLDEAITKVGFVVEEIGEGGRVPRVRAKNPSDHLVLLMAGEMLVGCKQDRVLNKSIMVSPRSELPIPVTCVEAGRWDRHSADFLSSGTSSYASLRCRMSKDVSDSYRTFGTPESDQAEVWRSVRAKMDRMGSASASDALHTVFEDYKERLSGSVEELAGPRDCQGVVFALNGQIEGADLFDRPSTLTKLWPKLAKAYAIDAIEVENGESKGTTASEVAEWLESASRSKTEWFDSPGLGKDGRIEGKRLHGGTLVVEDDLVHLEIFSEDEAPEPRSAESW